MPSHIICISGPEGVGKDTLINRVLEQFPQLSLGQKATTRKERDGDRDTPTGEPKYVFLSHDEFIRARAEGRIVEHSQNATGGLYGSFVEIGKPGVEIRDIDVNGALQLLAKTVLVERFPSVTLIGILPPYWGGVAEALVRAARSVSDEIVDGRYWATLSKSATLTNAMLAHLQARLIERGDSSDKIEQKLARARWEIPEILRTWRNNDIIVNDDLDEAVAELTKGIRHVLQAHTVVERGSAS